MRRFSFASTCLLAVLTLSTLAGSASAQLRADAPKPRSPIDWDRIGEETVRVLSEYLRINTTNPPGNELAAAHYLKTILEREGIEAKILDTAELGPGRANLYARLKGNGSKKAFALVHHMDVVPADARYWSVDPFSGAVKDGYVWGRGAQDMRGAGIMQLMALLAVKRSGLPLSRDLVFIANADEELGSQGAEIFVARHPDLLRDVEFLITEGGGGAAMENGKLTGYSIGTSEKRTFWQTLVVKGVPSHGSRPTKENPVPRLVAALYKISRWETPLHVTPTTARIFRDMAVDYTGEQQAWLSNVEAAIQDPRGRAWLLENSGWNAMLRNTISLTVLTGSNKTNVIPA